MLCNGTLLIVKWGTRLKSERLMKTSADSVVALATSTLLCVIVLMALSTLPEAEVPDQKFQYWW